ncbi:MAG: 8-oxo-dGTP diphosphatase MutT [Cellvibrionaceae bacterium]
MKSVHVAVGIVINDKNEILIAKRPDKLHQGGLWEFPGGKVEQDETVQEALIREFQEEVAIQIQQLEPFMEIHHDYGDKKVFLDIWLSSKFDGVAQGLEGQPIKWVALPELKQYSFPEANNEIVDKLLSSSFS